MKARQKEKDGCYDLIQAPSRLGVRKILDVARDCADLIVGGEVVVSVRTHGDQRIVDGGDFNEEQQQTIINLVHDIRSFKGGVRSIIDAGLNLNAHYNGYTPLGRAILRMDFELVIEMLEAGADPRIPISTQAEGNGRHFFSNRALHEAANRFAGDEAIGRLVAAGADPNQVDHNGAFALNYTLPHTELVHAFALIRFGADIHRLDSRGFTLLEHAISYGSPEMVRMLLELGMSPAARPDGAATPLHLACHRLNKLSTKGEHRIVSDLLEFGANPQAIGPDGETPLSMSKRGSHHWSIMMAFVSRARLKGRVLGEAKAQPKPARSRA